MQINLFACIIAILLSSGLLLAGGGSKVSPSGSDKQELAAQTSVNGSDNFVPVDKVPVLIENQNGAKKDLPVYPESAKKDSVEGKVFVSAVIGTDGLPKDIKIKKGARDDLNQSAMDYVKKMRFQPAEVKGQPVEMEIVIPIKFALKNK